MVSEPKPASKSQDRAYMPVKMTFRSHVGNTCDALSFKATWFLKVIFHRRIRTVLTLSGRLAKPPAVTYERVTK